MKPWYAVYTPIGGGAPLAHFPDTTLNPDTFRHHRITQVQDGLYVVDRGVAIGLDVHKPGDVAQVNHLAPCHLKLVEDGVVLFNDDLPNAEVLKQNLIAPGHAWNASFAIRDHALTPKRTPAQLTEANLIPYYGSQGPKVRFPAVGWGGNWPGPMGFERTMTIYMPTTGERGDIGMVVDAVAVWLAGGPFAAMTAWALSMGSFCFHWFDPNTKLPPSIITYPGINAYDAEDYQGIPGKPSPYVIKGPRRDGATGYFGYHPQAGVVQLAHLTDALYIPTIAFDDPVLLLWLQRLAIWAMGQSLEIYMPDGRRVIAGEHRGVGHGLGVLIKARAATKDAIARGYYAPGFHVTPEHLEELLANNLEFYLGRMRNDVTAQRFFTLPQGYDNIGFWQHNYGEMNFLLGALSSAPGWREMAERGLNSTVARFSGKSGWPPAFSAYYVPLKDKDGNPLVNWLEAFDRFYESEQENIATAIAHGMQPGDYPRTLTETQYLMLRNSDPMNNAGGNKMLGTTEYMMTDHAILEFASLCAKKGLLTLPPDFADARANCQKLFEVYGAVNPRVAVRDSEDKSGFKASLYITGEPPPPYEPPPANSPPDGGQHSPATPPDPGQDSPPVQPPNGGTMSVIIQGTAYILTPEITKPTGVIHFGVKPGTWKLDKADQAKLEPQGQAQASAKITANIDTTAEDLAVSVDVYVDAAKTKTLTIRTTLSDVLAEGTEGTIKVVPAPAD